jgi:hypothetical protein
LNINQQGHVHQSLNKLEQKIFHINILKEMNLCERIKILKIFDIIVVI